MTILDIGTTSAVINFNDSFVGMLRVLAKLVIIPGINSIGCGNKKVRIYQMNSEENELSKTSLQANTRYAKKIWWPIKILVYGCVRNPFKYS